MKKTLILAVLLNGAAFLSYAQAQEPAPQSAPEVVSVSPEPVPSAPPMTASEQTVPPAQTTAPGQPAPAGDLIAALPAPGQATAMPAMTPIEKEINEQLASLPPTVNINAMPSLFFSIWEHDLVLDARRGLTTRVPGTDDGLAQDSGPRDIALGGIVYVSSKDWTVWINSTRVSPTAIPEEVLDLKVFKDYIELEWFDETTNQVFPIRLRPHQRFNLDTRIFLPG